MHLMRLTAVELGTAVRKATGIRLPVTSTQDHGTPKPRTTSKQGTKTLSFRLDIQGLRAIAVGAVVLYHFWPNRLPGGFIGVDMFFVISGFLITSHLISKPPTGLRDVAQFWMRRVKRLLPASFLVILLSVLGVWLFAPETLWRDWGLQALAATFYFQNWYLALNKVDYLAEADAPSPFQHFWSLAVEEQFYFVWPVLLGLVIAAAAYLGKSRKKALLAVLGAVFFLGLGYSIYATWSNSGLAYFSTFTRVWEFAAGGLVAALGASVYKAKSDTTSLVGAWAGIVAIGFSLLFFTGEMPFPGYIALIPVLGTALLILSHSTHRYSPNRLLSVRPMQFIGDNSYAIYLWHWPLMVLLPFALENFYWYQKIGVLALTLLIAVSTQKLVEVRFRKFIDASPKLSAPRFLLAGSLVLTLIAGGFYQYSGVQLDRSTDINRAVAQVTKEVGKSCLGANSLSESCDEPQDDSTSFNSLAPQPVAAKSDKPFLYAEDCFASQETGFSERPVCHYGDGKTKVALVGNSHAGQWMPAVQNMADEHGWSVDTYVVNRCAVMGLPQEFDAQSSTEGCEELGGWVTEQIEEEDYDLVISSNRQSLPIAGYDLEESTAPATEAYEKLLGKWADSGADVAVIRDTPWPGETLDNIPDCVAENLGDPGECSGAADEWIPEDPQADAVEALDNPKVVSVDMNDQLCREDRCYSVVGGLVAYWDHSHLSETYAASLSGTLSQRMKDELDSDELFPAS